MPNRKSLYRAMEILPLLLVVVLVFSAICLANSKEIVLRYDGQEKVVTTILEDPRSILEESGVKVGKEDRILISPANAEKKTREVIELKRALPVTIEKYGVSKKFYTGKATVGEALDALAINYEGKTVYPAVLMSCMKKSSRSSRLWSLLIIWKSRMVRIRCWNRAYPAR